jgi:hypothetical protein
MFKIEIKHKNTYAEIAQKNPLRWQIMKREKNTLTSQSGLIKCKDFFNDVVAWKNGNHAFNIYNFDNKIEFNRYGVYFLLTEIADRDMFFANLEVLNSRLQADLNTKISFYKTTNKDKVVIHIPNPLWKNTYYISVVSMMIRLCNYAYAYEGWDGFFKEDAPLNTVESSFNDQAKARVKEFGFALPDFAKDCWYFARFGYTSKSGKEIIPSAIHNNGASDWALALLETK